MIPKKPRPTSGQRCMAKAAAMRIRIEEFLLSRLPRPEAEAVIAAMDRYAETAFFSEMV